MHFWQNSKIKSQTIFWSSLPKNSQAKWIECILDLLRNVQSTIWKFICTFDDQMKKNCRPLSRNKRSLDFLCARKWSFIYERVIIYLIFVSLKQNFCFVLLLELTDNNRKDSGLVFPFLRTWARKIANFFYFIFYNKRTGIQISNHQNKYVCTYIG